MISLPLFKQSVRSNLRYLLIFLAVLALYISVIVSMFDPALGSILKEFTAAMPQLMAMFGMDMAGTTLIGFQISYLYGFLLLLFPLIFSAMVANRLIARHVDRGSMAYLLAAPCTRRQVAVTQMAALLCGLTVMIAFCSGLGFVCSEVMFPGKLELVAYIRLNLGLFCFHIAVAGLCFLASCACNETRRSLMLGAGIPVLFFLIQMLANMGGKLEKLKYLTPFALFDPTGLAAGEGSALWMAGILLAAGALLFGTGIAVFQRRDLPL